jgi:phosphatidylinositol glycan class B
VSAEPAPAAPQAALLLLLVLILVAAVQSDGYHHPDEYFQTIEFASAKLGRTPVSDLPWEYPARIRGWLQPGLYVLIARSAAVVGITDPFSWAIAFRLTSGLLAFVAVVLLCRLAPRMLPAGEWSAAAVGGLCFAWFVPYLAVRTSSECLSGSCFLIGLALLLEGTDTPLVLGSAGFLFGLALELRYAVGVAVLGVFAWSLVYRRRVVLPLLLGLVPALALAAVVDRWGYGAWVVPAWNYLKTNLVEGRAAQRFGELPWYGFFSLAVGGPMAPFQVGLMLGALVFFVRRRSDPLTWAAAPFLVAHCLIRHKETRFLFPLAPLSSLLLVAGLAPRGDALDGLGARIFALRKSLPGRALLLVNLGALLVLCLVPLRPQVGFERYVFRHFPARFEAWLLTPFSPYVQDGIPVHFYAPRELVLHPVTEEPGPLQVTEAFEPPRGSGCVLLYGAFPGALRGLVEGVPAWDLYRCTGGRGRGVKP